MGGQRAHATAATLTRCPTRRTVASVKGAYARIGDVHRILGVQVWTIGKTIRARRLLSLLSDDGEGPVDKRLSWGSRLERDRTAAYEVGRQCQTWNLGCCTFAWSFDMRQYSGPSEGIFIQVFT